MINRRKRSPGGGRRRLVPQRGQGLVEFALVIPVFLFMIFGLIDGARFVFLNSALSQAAREGARVGSVEASYKGSTDSACGTSGGPACPATDSTLLADITTGANRMMNPFGSVGNVYMSCVADTASAPSGTWTTTTCPKNTSGNVISVRVTSAFTPITPGLSFLATTLSGTATMAIN